VDKNPDGSIKVIQTAHSRLWQEAPGVDDDDDDSHGTSVASVALGARYGVAKHATLVSVKWHIEDGVIDDINDAFAKVYWDIKDNGRENQAVVLCAIGDPGPSPANAESEHGSSAKRQHSTIRSIMEQGVPVITTAGNDRDGKYRENVDFWPSIWGSPTYPLIVVGETNDEGFRPEQAQGGLRVSTWAPAYGAIRLKKNGDAMRGSGSSLGTYSISELVLETDTDTMYSRRDGCWCRCKLDVLR
jgi:hypothetical protein